MVRDGFNTFHKNRLLIRPNDFLHPCALIQEGTSRNLGCTHFEKWYSIYGFFHIDLGRDV